MAYLPMVEMDRALSAGATAGFIKLIAGHRRVLRGLGGGRILGATVVAERAGELIHEPALALATGMFTGMFTGRLASATHAYPTWSYGLQLAAAQFFLPIGGHRACPVRTGRPRLSPRRRDRSPLATQNHEVCAGSPNERPCSAYGRPDIRRSGGTT